MRAQLFNVSSGSCADMMWRGDVRHCRSRFVPSPHSFPWQTAVREELQKMVRSRIFRMLFVSHICPYASAAVDAEVRH